jgi:hypothetical protein
MMGDIASMGGELFVMDDGWFGNKYPRKNDSSSLGDWVVDKNKLPEGIEGLIRDAKKHGIKFGIWIEPEMANTTSELYEKHPEWILKAPQRDPVLGRGGTQVVLDLANPEVQDFVFKVVDDLMTNYPEIAYIKWDANMAYFFESFVEFYIHMALFIRRQIVGTMIHDSHVCIPFDISYFRVICHQVVYDFKYEILYFRIGQVKYYLCTSTSQYRVTLRSFQYPFRMFFIQFAGRVCHFRLYPDTKLDSVFLGVSYQSLNAFGKLVLVYYPVAQ